MSPFIYSPSDLVQQFRGLEFAAKRFGLLEQKTFDVGIPETSLPARIEQVLKGARIELLSSPWRTVSTPNVVPFGKDGVAVDEDRACSGIRTIGHVPSAWVHTIDGRINAVDLLREVGSLIESSYANWLSIVLGRGTKSSARVELAADRTVEVKRDDAVAFSLERAGYKLLDHTRLYTNSHASVLQSLAIALLLKVDVRWVLIDVLYRAKEDPMMHRLAEGLARRSGVDWSDREELEDYAATNFGLHKGPEDPFYYNLYEINSLALYFAKHLNLNVRMAAAGAPA